MGLRQPAGVPAGGTDVGDIVLMSEWLVGGQD